MSTHERLQMLKVQKQRVESQAIQPFPPPALFHHCDTHVNPAVNERGKTYVFEANPKAFRLIGENNKPAVPDGTTGL